MGCAVVTEHLLLLSLFFRFSFLFSLPLVLFCIFVFSFLSLLFVCCCLFDHLDRIGLFTHRCVVVTRRRSILIRTPSGPLGSCPLQEPAIVASFSFLLFPFTSSLPFFSLFHFLLFLFPITTIRQFHFPDSTDRHLFIHSSLVGRIKTKEESQTLISIQASPPFQLFPRQ